LKAVVIELPLAFCGVRGDHLDQLFEEKHQEMPKTSYKWMRDING
jgi:hypothetical protein